MIKKLPPHNIDNEYSVISAALVSREALIKVIEYGEEIYYLENNRKAWGVLNQLFDMEIDFDLNLFKTILEDQEKIKPEYILEIIDHHCSGYEVEGLLEDLHKKWKSRETIRLTTVIQEKSFAKQSIDDEINELVELDQKCNKSVKLHNIADLADKTLEELQEKREYLSTGIKALDQAILGFRAEQLIIIAAEPGGGKTSLTWQMLTDIPDSLFITLEQTKEELYIKLLSRIATVNSMKIEVLNLFPDELQRIHEAKKHIKENVKTTVIDEQINLIQICNAIRKQARRGQVSICCVENLGLVTGAKGDDKADRYNYICRTLKLLAKEIQIPIIINAHQNKIKDEPELIDLNYISGADADMVLFCWNESIIIAKARGCDTVRVPDLSFIKKYSRFESTKIDKFNEI